MQLNCNRGSSKTKASAKSKLSAIVSEESKRGKRNTLPAGPQVHYMMPHPAMASMFRDGSKAKENPGEPLVPRPVIMSVRSGVFKDRSNNNNLDIMYASSDAVLKKGEQLTESAAEQSPKQFSFAEPTASQKRD